MEMFFKTFVICLVLSLGFLSYKFVSESSYSPELKMPSRENIFSIQKENDKPYQKNENEIGENIIQNNIVEPDMQYQEVQTPKKEEKKVLYSHTCYFYTVNGELVPFKRELPMKPSLETAISILLKGPLIVESKKGVYSEIPPNVDLISIKRNENSIIVDLSSNFGNGGGTQSVENRIKQLTKTIKYYQPKKNIYLYMNGKEVEYLGGDGVYIKQPLE